MSNYNNSNKKVVPAAAEALNQDEVYLSDRLYSNMK